MKFFGTKALIIGGSSEIGIKLAELILQAGLSPILTYRNEAGKKTIDEKLPNMDISTVKLDLADVKSIDNAFEQIENISYLIDLAQGNLESLIATADPAEVLSYFEQNITNRAYLIKKAGRAMLAQRQGRMIFLSSTAAQLPNQGQGFYAAAKLASEALYKNLGLELAGKGITSISLRAGYIKTGRGKLFLEKHKDFLKKIPSGKAFSAAEIAENILFLLSDAALGYNATHLTLDGGLTAGK